MCLPLSVAHEDVILKEQRQYTQGGLCCDELVPLNANLQNNKIGMPCLYNNLFDTIKNNVTE